MGFPTGASRRDSPGSGDRSRSAGRSLLRAALTGVLLGSGLPAVLSGTALAAPCDEPPNEIVAENCLPGNPSAEWDVSGAGSATIQGFATDISVDRGQTVSFKVDTLSTDYRLDIYRMGYYGGMGARRVTTLQPSAILPQIQPECLGDPSTGLIDCGNWSVSASWSVPANATSGIYLAKLVREDGPSGSSHVVFIVRDDGGGSDLLFQTSDTTWQAYNSYGGNSLYQGEPAGRAYKVSYNRPFNTRASSPEDWVFNAEYPMVRWLERNGYDVSYFTGVDADRRGSEILEHEIFLSVGHDEYWSGGQRTAVETARDAGVDLAFLSGNEVFWKTRWEDSIDGSSSPYRTLVSYKETHADAKIDPLPNVWTGTWRDPRFSPPADGGRPENGLTGTIFTVNCCTYAIEVPAADGAMRLWRDTTIADLSPGQSATLPGGTLGYEWDEDLDNGFRPPGLFHQSTTTVDVPQRILDHGSTYGPGRATHHLTLYRDPNGGGQDAVVFGAGTVQWSWGLDGNHDRGGSVPDVRMQQATVNLFADMGVQPATLQADLVAASASSDTAAPTSVITSPVAGAAVESGTQVVVTGTASDAGGGVVGGVEVSTDGGASWHPAAGRDAWSFTWTPTAVGSTTIQSRAVDDSGNLEVPSPGVTVTVTADGCPCTRPVTVGDTGFRPRNTTAQQGDTVQWDFTGGTHSATDPSGMVLFDSGPRNAGESYQFTFTSAGRYTVDDAFSANTGTIVVPVQVSPASGTTATVFTVTWGSAPLSGGFQADVQIRRPGTTRWANWMVNQTGITSAGFTPDAGAGTYQIRARLENAGGRSRWSPAVSITVS